MIETIMNVDSDLTWTVKLDGKKVGEIRAKIERVGDAEKFSFRYYPQGKKKYAGGAFATLRDCRNSLEME